jgi:hypothetical protein
MTIIVLLLYTIGREILFLKEKRQIKQDFSAELDYLRQSIEKLEKKRNELYEILEIRTIPELIKENSIPEFDKNSYLSEESQEKLLRENLGEEMYAQFCSDQNYGKVG